MDMSDFFFQFFFDYILENKFQKNDLFQSSISIGLARFYN